MVLLNEFLVFWSWGWSVRLHWCFLHMSALWNLKKTKTTFQTLSENGSAAYLGLGCSGSLCTQFQWMDLIPSWRTGNVAGLNVCFFLETFPKEWHKTIQSCGCGSSWHSSLVSTPCRPRGAVLPVEGLTKAWFSNDYVFWSGYDTRDTDDLCSSRTSRLICMQCGP